MMGGLWRYMAAAKLAVERHGGGWRGLRAVLVRSVRVLRALGLAGFTARLRRAGSAPAALPPAAMHVFRKPVPLAQVKQRIGVMAHVFYPDLVGELARDLADMPLPYQLLVSVVDEDAAEQANIYRDFRNSRGWSCAWWQTAAAISLRCW